MTPTHLSLLSLIAVGNISYLVKDFNEIKPGQTGRPEPGGASSIDLTSSLMRLLYGGEMISDYLPFFIKYRSRLGRDTIKTKQSGLTSNKYPVSTLHVHPPANKTYF